MRLARQFPTSLPPPDPSTWSSGSASSFVPLAGRRGTLDGRRVHATHEAYLRARDGGVDMLRTELTFDDGATTHVVSYGGHLLCERAAPPPRFEPRARVRRTFIDADARPVTFELEHDPPYVRETTRIDIAPTASAADDARGVRRDDARPGGAASASIAWLEHLDADRLAMGLPPPPPSSPFAPNPHALRPAVTAFAALVALLIVTASVVSRAPRVVLDGRVEAAPHVTSTRYPDPTSTFLSPTFAIDRASTLDVEATRPRDGDRVTVRVVLLRERSAEAREIDLVVPEHAGHRARARFDRLPAGSYALRIEPRADGEDRPMLRLRATVDAPRPAMLALAFILLAVPLSFQLARHVRFELARAPLEPVDASNAQATPPGSDHGEGHDRDEDGADHGRDEDPTGTRAT